MSNNGIVITAPQGPQGNQGAPYTVPKIPTATTSTGVSVGSSSTTVLAANVSRNEAIIVNDSIQDIYLTYGPSATMNSGVLIKAGGGYVVETDYDGIITGICLSGGANVTVTEL